MTTLQNLKELQDRLERAYEDDFEDLLALDASIFRLFPEANNNCVRSLDSAIALVEAKLPGMYRLLQMDDVGQFTYVIQTPKRKTLGYAWHKSEPIALLLAFIQALIEKENRNEG